MPLTSRSQERSWGPANYDPLIQKVELFDGRKAGQGRTILSKLYPGHSAPPQYSISSWTVLVWSGDLTIAGVTLVQGDVVSIPPQQSVTYTTRAGCEIFIFVRGEHAWGNGPDRNSNLLAVKSSDRRWNQSSHDPNAKRIELLPPPINTDGRSLLSMLLPGRAAAPQRSSAPWDILVLAGDLILNDTEMLGPGDHVLCAAEEKIIWETRGGCECLVFSRSPLEWLEKL